jgi:hypothetical protein
MEKARGVSSTRVSGFVLHDAGKENEAGLLRSGEGLWIDAQPPPRHRTAAVLQAALICDFL